MGVLVSKNLQYLRLQRTAGCQIAVATFRRQNDLFTISLLRRNQHAHTKPRSRTQQRLDARCGLVPADLAQLFQLRHRPSEREKIVHDGTGTRKQSAEVS